MYETAIANAEKAGDGGKARRYKRGLKVQKTKTIQSMSIHFQLGNRYMCSEPHRTRQH
jgi:hypothetical protein